jgi:hypothetical protein
MVLIECPKKYMKLTQENIIFGLDDGMIVT